MGARKDSAGGDEIDALFQLPLPDFTAARNTLVAALKKAGRDNDASALKALQKPPLTAWAVNQLHWRHSRELAALRAAGDRFREAQRAQLAGKRADLRATLDAWREALGAMTTKAGEVLQGAGHRPTPDLMRRVSTTLEALAAYGTGPDAPAAGRLTGDLDPPGFDALTALVPRGASSLRGNTPTRVIPFTGTRPADAKGASRTPQETAKQRAAARVALDTARRTLAEARRAAQQAEAALKKAAAVAKVAEQKRAVAEKGLDRATRTTEEAVRESETATKEARRVARVAEEAAQAVTDAEREVEHARAAITK